jgi:hypothetical protein
LSDKDHVNPNRLGKAKSDFNNTSKPSKEEIRKEAEKIRNQLQHEKEAKIADRDRKDSLPKTVHKPQNPSLSLGSYDSSRSYRNSEINKEFEDKIIKETKKVQNKIKQDRSDKDRER